MEIGRYLAITVMTALLSLLACPSATAYRGAPADLVAGEISSLLASFAAPVIKTSDGKIYLAIRRYAPPAPGALAEIINPAGARVGMARIISVSGRLAVANIIKSYGAVNPGRDIARGVRWPARILWISADDQDKQASALLSSIEEAVRELGSVDLVPPDVAHSITATRPGAPPSALPKDELAKTASATGADFIMLVSTAQKGDGAMRVKLTLLDNMAGHLLEITVGPGASPAGSR